MSADDPRIAAVNRRQLLKLVGAASAGALPLGAAAAGGEGAPADPNPCAPTASQPMQAPAQNAAPVLSPRVPRYTFFNFEEVLFIEAAVDTLIPADEVGPGALELGVASFIDGQMSSGYGRGDRMYLQGPFIEGTPEQGYQLRMTPAELVRAGIKDVDSHCRLEHQAAFHDIAPPDRIAVLHTLEAGTAALATVPAQIFFNLIYGLTLQGYFSDPIHGGNYGKGSWKMLGFPGVGAMYADKITQYHNKRYVADPVGIQDLL
jgi:gluconate 2-dehydrogenase gamma chain